MAAQPKHTMPSSDITGSASRPQTTTPYDLGSFDVADPADAQRKFAMLRAATPKNIMLVADFDNTVTKRGHSVWETLRNTLPEDGRLESDAERKTNMAKERAGELTVEEVIRWSKNELNRYAQYGITTAAIEQAAQHVQLRRGARKLFNVCTDGGIESHILSASVAEAIEQVVKSKRLRTTRVHSNRLRTKNGIVVEWDEISMLHTLNKHEHALRVILGGIAPENDPRCKIVLGDNRHDADMVAGDHALRIRVRGKHGNTPQYLAESFSPSDACKGFDLVLRTESLLPVVDLIRWILEDK